MLTGGRLLTMERNDRGCPSSTTRRDFFIDCTTTRTFITILVVDSYIEPITCVLPESIKVFLMLIQL